jgi:hypothetical protein
MVILCVATVVRDESLNRRFASVVIILLPIVYSTNPTESLCLTKARDFLTEYAAIQVGVCTLLYLHERLVSASVLVGHRVGKYTIEQLIARPNLPSTYTIGSQKHGERMKGKLLTNVSGNTGKQISGP